MKKLIDFTSIIVHPGKSHLDERLAVALALAANDIIVPVYRREPTEDELQNQEVLVIDIGGRLDEWSQNFDHHQLPREHAPECAFSLVAKAIGVAEDLESFFDWFSTWRKIDSKGPFQWAKESGVDWGAASSLLNPDMDIVAEWWEEAHDETPVDEALVRRLKKQGEKILIAAESCSFFCEDAENRRSWTPINGVQVFDLTWADPSDALAYGDAYAKRHAASGGIIVSKDDRGPGLALFRRNDDPAVDFCRVAGDPEVTFSHSGGFIAKTAAGADWRRLVATAIKPPKK